MREGRGKVACGPGQVSGPKQGKGSVHPGGLPGSVSESEQVEQDVHAWGWPAAR